MLPNSCLCPVSVEYSILLFLRSHLHTLCSKCLFSFCNLFLNSLTAVFINYIFYCYFYLGVKIMKIKTFLHSYSCKFTIFVSTMHTKILSFYKDFFYEHIVLQNLKQLRFVHVLVFSSLYIGIYYAYTSYFKLPSTKCKKKYRSISRKGDALNVVQMCCERPLASNIRRQSLYTTNLLKYRCELTILQLYLLF